MLNIQLLKYINVTVINTCLGDKKFSKPKQGHALKNKLLQFCHYFTLFLIFLSLLMLLFKPRLHL